MKQMPEPSIRIRINPANPGHFFACCGLLELADRFWKGAEAWFCKNEFCLVPVDGNPPIEPTLGILLDATANAHLQQIDGGDEFSSPIGVGSPFEVQLDWWKDSRSGGKQFKLWAGKMSGFRIARSMQNVLGKPELQNERMLDYCAVVFDPLDSKKKVEPFYFDARRGVSARPRDIGFSPDKLAMTTGAHPAVEFLSLVGLQRFRALPTETRRVFEYCTWAIPLAPDVASCAVFGILPHIGVHRFSFEVAFRTDQRKHKAFQPATQVEGAFDDRSFPV